MGSELGRSSGVSREETGIVRRRGFESFVVRLLAKTVGAHPAVGVEKLPESVGVSFVEREVSEGFDLAQVVPDDLDDPDPEHRERKRAQDERADEFSMRAPPPSGRGDQCEEEQNEHVVEELRAHEESRREGASRREHRAAAFVSNAAHVEIG